MQVFAIYYKQNFIIYLLKGLVIYETFKWVIPFKGQAEKLHIGK